MLQRPVSGSRLLVRPAQMNGHPAPFIVEDGYKLEVSTEPLEVLAKCRHPDVIGVPDRRKGRETIAPRSRQMASGEEDAPTLTW